MSFLGPLAGRVLSGLVHGATWFHCGENGSPRSLSVLLLSPVLVVISPLIFDVGNWSGLKFINLFIFKKTPVFDLNYVAMLTV